MAALSASNHQIRNPPSRLLCWSLGGSLDSHIVQLGAQVTPPHLTYPNRLSLSQCPPYSIRFKSNGPGLCGKSFQTALTNEAPSISISGIPSYGILRLRGLSLALYSLYRPVASFKGKLDFSPPSRSHCYLHEHGRYETPILPFWREFPSHKRSNPPKFLHQTCCGYTSLTQGWPYTLDWSGSVLHNWLYNVS